MRGRAASSGVQGAKNVFGEFSPREQIGDERLLFLQFILGGCDFGAAEVVVLHALHDLPLLAVGADRIAEQQPLFNAVAAISANRNARPIAGGRGVDERAHGV